MNINVKFMALLTTVLCLIWSASACVELGALAYDDWTSTDGGGSGMLAYLRQDGKIVVMNRSIRIQRDSHGHPPSVTFGLLAVSNQQQLDC